MSIEDLLQVLPDEWRPAHSENSNAESEPPVSRIQGGRNNQVYRFQTADHRDCIAKRYHGVPVDEATRLWREYSFLHLMREGGIRCVPEILFADFEGHLAIFPFVGGDKPPEGWQEPWGIDRAVEFLGQLEALRSHPASHEVPNASEACFTLKAHAAALRKRLDRLESIEQTDPIAEDAHRFFQSELRPFSEDLIARVESAPAADRELDREEKWLSPSDFGFHNTLISNDREMVFLDFEHAGWDDPAKLIADFCNQPDHVLSDGHAEKFQNGMFDLVSDPEPLRERVALLTPLYQSKWACILLNEFLPFGSKRREFLGRSPEEESAEKVRQLNRSRTLLERARTSAP